VEEFFLEWEEEETEGMDHSGRVNEVELVRGKKGFSKQRTEVEVLCHNLILIPVTSRPTINNRDCVAYQVVRE
jgi:hypothetical protein